MLSFHMPRSLLPIFIAYFLLPGTRARAQNILWLTIEDSSPYVLGAYGNPHVRTPHIDSLAENGLRFTNFSSTAPYCSPARSTIISGQYAYRYGTDWHREGRLVPEERYFFPRFVRQAGYFTSNNKKTDYNVAPDQFKEELPEVWDRQGRDATYNDPARAGRPFFSVFNNLVTHMSRLCSVTTAPRDSFRILPQSLTVPPHLPDLPDIRNDLAWHYEKAEEADRWVGLVLADLRAQGLADSTIVFFYADHGGCLPRGKAFPFETGLRTPLVVYVPPALEEVLPEGWAPGGVIDDLVDFTDLAPTVLTLAGARVPGFLDGEAFLGIDRAPKKPMQYGFRTNTHDHYDPSRTAYDGRYKYIRFFTPYRPDGVRQEYQWRMPANLAWDNTHLIGQTDSLRSLHFLPKPTELLFDLEADPWELHNLSFEPAHREALLRLRDSVRRHAHAKRDLGFLPKQDRYRSDSLSLYEWVNRTGFSVDSLIDAAYLASGPSVADTTDLLELLRSPERSFRFWGASGLATLAQRDSLRLLPDAAHAFVDDPDEEVRVALALAFAFSEAPEPGYAILRPLILEGSLEAATAAMVLRERAAPLAAALSKCAQGEDYAGRFYARSALINLGKVAFADLYEAEARERFLRYYDEIQRSLGGMPYR